MKIKERQAKGKPVCAQALGPAADSIRITIDVEWFEAKAEQSIAVGLGLKTDASRHHTIIQRRRFFEHTIRSD
jgi:hypothetical protein